MTRSILVLALVALVEVYSFSFVKTLIGSGNSRYSLPLLIIYLLVTLGSYGLAFYGFTGKNLPHGLRYYLFNGLMLLFISKLIASLFLFLADGVRIGHFFWDRITNSSEVHLAGRRTLVKNVAIALFSLPFITMLYGMARTAFDFRIVRHKVPIKGLPDELVGMKILQISDLHSGSFVSEDLMAKAFDLIEKESADLIAFTGDLVNNVADETTLFLRQYKRLKAPLGVYSILGNHDYGDYVSWESEQAKKKNLQSLIEVHRNSGWDILLNEHRIVKRNGVPFAVIGVENWGAAMHFPKYGRLSDALNGLPDVPFRLLLSHDPSHWDAEVVGKHPDIHLTLSGHTHGFQFGIEIPGIKWSPVQYVYKQWAGLYDQMGQHLNVNRGLGFIGYMGRIGIAPEITVIELARAL